VLSLLTPCPVLPHRNPAVPAKYGAAPILDIVSVKDVISSGHISPTGRTLESTLAAARAAGVTVNYAADAVPAPFSTVQPAGGPATRSRGPVSLPVVRTPYMYPHDDVIRSMRRALREAGLNPFGSRAEMMARYERHHAASFVLPSVISAFGAPVHDHFLRLSAGWLWWLIIALPVIVFYFSAASLSLALYNGASFSIHLPPTPAAAPAPTWHHALVRWFLPTPGPLAME